MQGFRMLYTIGRPCYLISHTLILYFYRYRSWVLMTVQRRILSECSWRKTEQTPKLHTVNVLTQAQVALMTYFDALNSFVHVFICLVESRAHESCAAWSLEVM